MLQTIFGELQVLVDHMPIDYSISELEKKEKRFDVNGRYKIAFPFESDLEQHTVECSILITEGFAVESGSDTGERLAMITFTSADSELSIGTEGDIEGILYEYFKNGMRLLIGEGIQTSGMVFYVAWTVGVEKKGTAFTWFAADPTLQ